METELTQFLEFINGFVPLSSSDVESMMPHIQYVEYERKESILDINQKCKGIYYVIDGLLRIYTIKDGTEVNVEFMAENEFFTDYESLMTDSICKCSVEAIEKTRALYLPYDKLLEAYEKSHMLERLGRLMVERAFVLHLARSNASSNLKAEQKYLEYETEFPKMANRVPLKHLASYFGITPESLSRIRKSRFQSIS